MGVTWVFEYPINETSGRSAPQMVNEIEKHLEAVGAEKTGNFKVDSLPYRPIIHGGICTVHLLHHSEYPHNSFTIVADPKEKPGVMTRGVSDRGFDLILAKLTAGLAADPTARFDCTGGRFSLADWTVKAGTVTMASVVKGVLIEIEYLPISVPTLCTALLRELVHAALPPLAHLTLPPPYILSMSSASLYQPIDTLHQYLELFLDFRRRSVLQQPSRPPQTSFQPPPSSTFSQ